MSVFKPSFILFASAAMLASSAFAQTVPVSSCVANPAAPFGNTGSLVRVITLATTLSNSNVNPVPSNRTGTGMGTFTVRLERTSTSSLAPTRAVITSDLQVTGGQAESITGGSIAPGVVGTNGTALFMIQPTSPIELVSGQQGSIQRQVEVTDMATLNALGAILANPSAYYVSVNSTGAPSGLVRGQLRLSTADAEACSNDKLSIILRLVTLLASTQNVISAAERDALLGIATGQSVEVVQ